MKNEVDKLKDRIKKSGRGKTPNPSIQSKIDKYSKGKGVDQYAFSYEIHSINQYAILKNGWDLDYIDVAIFHEINSYITSGKAKRNLDERDQAWYFISEEMIIKHLPMLPINSVGTVIKRISNLCKYELLERNPDNRRNGQKFVRIGPNAQLLFYTRKEEMSNDQ
jgi:hypothetical protein